VFEAAIPQYRRSRLTGRCRPNPVAFRVAREVLIVAVATLLYFVARGLVDGREVDAFANADWLIDLERRLGVFWEPALQAWTLEHDWLVSLANAVYIWGHWPVIAGTLVWLLVAHREHVARYRNAMLVSGAIGLVCFVAVPMAPPRFLAEWGFVDTVTLQTNAYRVLQPPALTNQHAAMPSLHVGWNLLMGIALARHAASPVAKAFGLLMPLAMWVATVLTANHYLLDGLVGSAVALIGLGVAGLVRRRGIPSLSMVRHGTGCGPTLARTVRSVQLSLVAATVAALAIAYLGAAGFRAEVGRGAAVLGRGDADVLREYLLSFGAWAPIISLLLMVAQAVVAPVPAFLVVVANGLAFGVFWGGMLSLVGQALAAAVCFGIAWSFGRKPVEAIAGKLGLAPVTGWFARRGVYGILLARLVPGMAFDAVSYAAGVTGIGFWRFLAATVVGSAPQAFAYAYLGQHAPRFAWAPLVLTGLVIGGVAATTVVRRRRREHDRSSAASPRMFAHRDETNGGEAVT